MKSISSICSQISNNLQKLIKSPQPEEEENRNDSDSFKSAIIRVFNSVIIDYRRGLKSPNKFYSKANPIKLRSAQRRIPEATVKVTEMREFWTPHRYREELLSSVPAAKCQELAVAMMDRSIRHGFSAAVWELGRGQNRHAFTVLTKTDDELSNLRTSKSLSSSAWKATIIADPWMNICCPAGNYVRAALEKMNKWNLDSKRIYDSEHQEWVSPRNPDWIRGIRGKKRPVASNDPRLRRHQEPASEICAQLPSEFHTTPRSDEQADRPTAKLPMPIGTQIKDP